MNEVYSGGRKVRGELYLKEYDPYAVGVFESLRTYQGKIFHLEAHVERFMDSARTAGLQNLSARMIKEEVLLALKAFHQDYPKLKKDDVFIRVTAWPYGAKPGRKIFCVITQRKHAAEIYQKGVSLRTSSVRRSLSHASPPQAKTTAYQNPLLATLEPSQGYEWVFLDQAGYVTEVRIGNLFIVKNKKIVTPPTTGILNGVTRRFVLECARTAKISALETPLTRYDIFNADEAFLTNTSWEILPVRELDGRKVGGKIPGPLTLKLHQLFKKSTLN